MRERVPHGSNFASKSLRQFKTAIRKTNRIRRRTFAEAGHYIPTVYPVLCNPAAIPLIVAPSGYSSIAAPGLAVCGDQFHLNQAHRIHIGIAQMNRPRQNPIP